MANRKGTKLWTIVENSVHRKLNIKEHEPH